MDVNQFSSGFSSALMQNQLRTAVIQKISTGSPIVDAIIGIALVNVVDRAATSVWDITGKAYRWGKLAAQVGYTRIAPPPKVERGRVDFITEDREKNELYEVVHWYIADKGKTLPGTQMHFERTPVRRGTISHPPRDNVSTFTWDGVEVTATIRTEVMTIRAERNQERDNMIIDLVAKTSDKTYIKRFLEHAEKKKKEYDETAHFEQKIYTNDGNQWRGISVDMSSNRGKNLILKRGQKERLLEDFEDFINGEREYDDYNVPWTRGYMFYGKPGTGKSTFIKTMASISNRHIYYLKLKELKNNKDLTNLLNSIKFKRSILVIEDIDADSPVVKRRDSEEPLSVESAADDKSKRTKDHKEPESITLSDLLNNLFDGQGRDNKGQIIVITTNRPDVLDEALVRGRRIDVKEDFGYCDDSQIEDLFENFFKEPLDLGIKFRDNIAPADVVCLMLVHKKDISEARKAFAKEFGANPPMGIYAD